MCFIQEFKTSSFKKLKKRFSETTSHFFIIESIGVFADCSTAVITTEETIIKKISNTIYYNSKRNVSH